MTNTIKKEETVQVQAIVNNEPVTPMHLISAAQQQGADIEKMQQLFDLQLRWEENEALKAYNKSIAQFKAENVRIRKDGTVDFTGAKGRTYYKFETLAHVVNTVVPLLAKYGLNHSWRTEQQNDKIKVTCKLAHAKGHSESISLFAAADNTGNKNPIQAIKSTVSYLERITLTSILGLAASDQDDDAQGYQEQQRVETISEEEAAELQALIDEVKADETQFLTWAKTDAIENIPKPLFRKAVILLEKKRDKS